MNAPEELQERAENSTCTDPGASVRCGTASWHPVGGMPGTRRAAACGPRASGPVKRRRPVPPTLGVGGTGYVKRVKLRRG
ncbi:hypothetical protein GCM10010230_50760 [Streptomyces narbonensis]|nr:hypothetical protein GCM10010230_50760 [Streptomyces narbonensis]